MLQIALLEEGLYRVKMDFNQRFLALRDVKRSVCARLQEKYAKLADVNEQLGIQEQLRVPEMQEDEEPERREEVTDADIAAFLRTQEEEAAAAAGAQGGGFGGFEGKSGAKGNRAAADGASGAKDGAPAAKAGNDRRGVRRQGDTPEEAIARVAANTPLSPLEQAEQKLRERLLV